MADIKKAAKWMKKGEQICRKRYPDHIYYCRDKRDESDDIFRRLGSTDHGTDLLLRVSDLLAEDWEIAK